MCYTAFLRTVKCRVAMGKGHSLCCWSACGESLPRDSKEGEPLQRQGGEKEEGRKGRKKFFPGEREAEKQKGAGAAALCGTGSLPRREARPKVAPSPVLGRGTGFGMQQSGFTVKVNRSAGEGALDRGAAVQGDGAASVRCVFNRRSGPHSVRPEEHRSACPPPKLP